MNTSYWMKQTKQKKSYPKIEHDCSSNIVVIGAGLTGLSTAYYTSNATQEMMILEADTIGYGASGRNTGKVTFQHGLLYAKFIEKYDRIFAKRYYQAQKDAMDSIQSIIKQHHITCDFHESDALLYTNDPTKIQDLQDEYQAYLDLDIPCEFIKESKCPTPLQAGILVKHQYSFNPYAYCLGLSNVLDERNISIYEHSAVHDMKDCEDGYDLFVNGHIVHANKVVFACQFPFIDRMHLYFTRVRPMQESICYSTLLQKHFNVMAINIEQPMHSANIFDAHIVMTGNQHKSGQGSKEEVASFEKQLYSLYPIHEIHESWSSEDYFTFDHLPMIGKLEKHNPNLLFASGFCGWGNTTSNMAAKILTAYLLDQSSVGSMLASPQRPHLLSLPFFQENTNTLYYYVKGRLQRKDIDYPLKGEAKQMEIDGHRYGVYRDEQDELFIVDITCPHMGCVCNFNEIDKTWDCPCHGSRFTYQGDIVKGPACEHLHAKDEDTNNVDPHILK